MGHLELDQPEQAPGAAGRATDLKRPESVLVVVFTLGGEVLMLRRNWPSGFWQSVTGSLKRGERPQDAAVREVREETGLAVTGLLDLLCTQRFPIPHKWRDRYAPGVHYNREHWLALPLAHRRAVRLQPREHSEYVWLPAARAAALTASWTNRLAIQRLFGWR